MRPGVFLLTQASVARNINYHVLRSGHIRWPGPSTGTGIVFSSIKDSIVNIRFSCFRDLAFHFSNENWSTKRIWICYKHDDMAKTFAYLICKILSIIVFFIYTITLDYYKQARVIPDNCYGHHGRWPCKNILSGVKFSVLNTKTAYILLFRGIFGCS